MKTGQSEPRATVLTAARGIEHSLNKPDGVVKETWVAAGQVGSLAANLGDKTLLLSLLQDQPRDHSLGGDASHPISAVAS